MLHPPSKVCFVLSIKQCRPIESMICVQCHLAHLRTVDTDVIVTGVALRLCLNELWIEFGTGKHKQFYEVYALYKKLGQRKPSHLSSFMLSRATIRYHSSAPAR